MKKKIMIIANNDTWVYKLRKETILALLDQGYDVTISSPKGDSAKLLEALGCRLVNSKLDRRSMNPVKDLKLLLYYINLLRSERPDIVLAYTIKPNMYGSLASRLLKIPYINNITGLGSGFSKTSILQMGLSYMYKICLKKSKCVFFQNTEDRNILVNKKIVRNNYELIPGSGVNLSEFEFKPLPEVGLIFTFIGRIMKDKGIDQYLEAAKIITRKYPETKFNLIGFIEKTQSHYNEVIKACEEEGYIKYWGFQSDVKSFIEQTHCIIQPSHGGEGVSNVLLESAAMGRVLIASDIPGCRETINEGENGYLFKPKDTDDLVEKIDRLIRLNYSEKAKMGINSRRKVEKEFDRKLVVEAYIKKIKTIV